MSSVAGPAFAVGHFHGKRGAAGIAVTAIGDADGDGTAEIAVAGATDVRRDTGDHQVGHFLGHGTGSGAAAVGAVVAGGVGIIVRGVP